MPRYSFILGLELVHKNKKTIFSLAVVTMAVPRYSGKGRFPEFVSVNDILVGSLFILANENPAV